MADDLRKEIFEKPLSTASRELFNLIIGAEIGSGLYRTVYAANQNPNIVIKFEGPSGNFSNVKEFEIWERFMRTEYAKWLAPIDMISPCGCFLVQRRTAPITREQLPKAVPWFLTDLKLDNWGMLKGRPVCHDYAIFIDHWPPEKQRLKKAKFA